MTISIKKGLKKIELGTKQRDNIVPTMMNEAFFIFCGVFEILAFSLVLFNN